MMKNSHKSTVVQRLIIYHEGFACRDESASLEELAEYILYYFDAKHHIVSSYCDDQNKRDLWIPNEEKSVSSRKILDDDEYYDCNENEEDAIENKKREDEKKAVLYEAIKFVGMCETLQGFTHSFSSSSLTPPPPLTTTATTTPAPTSQRTQDTPFLQEVNLANSTLVFVPLEGKCTAVAEVYRRSIPERPRKITFDNPCTVCNTELNSNGSLPPPTSLDHKKPQQYPYILHQIQKKLLKSTKSSKSETVNEHNGHHPLCTNVNSITAAGGDPDSVRETIRKCHLLFCMLGGKGGIIHRIGMGNTKHNKEENMEIELNEMDRIAQLRKKLRRSEFALGSLLHETVQYESKNDPNNESDPEKNSTNDSSEELEFQIQQMRDVIAETRQSIIKMIPKLPITTLRHDLQMHFDTVLTDLLFPYPLKSLYLKYPREKRALNDIPGISPVSDIDITGNLMVGRLMDGLLDAFQNEGLVGISAIYDRKLLWTQCQTRENNNMNRTMSTDASEKLISREETLFLYEYFMKLQGTFPLPEPGITDKLESTKSTKSTKTIDKSSVSSVSIKNDDNDLKSTSKTASRRKSTSSEPTTTRISPAITGTIGYFACPPSESSYSNELDSISLGNQIFLWFLGIFTLMNDNGKRRDFLANSHHTDDRFERHHVEKHRVMAYFCGNFHFLLFFRPILKSPKSSPRKQRGTLANAEIDTSDSKPSAFLCVKMAEYISSEVMRYEEKRQKQFHFLQKEGIIQHIKKYKGEPGVDIIFRDRREHNVEFYIQNPEPLQKSKNIHPQFWNHINYPHVLAMNLPHNVRMALNEVFAEIQKRDDSSSGHDFPTREICTSLPQKWVYGTSHGYRELVIIFDAKKFVTFADVQKAVSRIKNEMLNRVIL